jgi:hypothetical protein
LGYYFFIKVKGRRVDVPPVEVEALDVLLRRVVLDPVVLELLLVRIPNKPNVMVTKHVFGIVLITNVILQAIIVVGYRRKMTVKRIQNAQFLPTAHVVLLPNHTVVELQKILAETIVFGIHQRLQTLLILLKILAPPVQLLMLRAVMTTLKSRKKKRNASKQQVKMAPLKYVNGKMTNAFQHSKAQRYVGMDISKSLLLMMTQQNVPGQGQMLGVRVVNARREQKMELPFLLLDFLKGMHLLR